MHCCSCFYRRVGFCCFLLFLFCFLFFSFWNKVDSRILCAVLLPSLAHSAGPGPGAQVLEWHLGSRRTPPQTSHRKGSRRSAGNGSYFSSTPPLKSIVRTPGSVWDALKAPQGVESSGKLGELGSFLQEPFTRCAPGAAAVSPGAAQHALPAAPLSSLLASFPEPLHSQAGPRQQLLSFFLSHTTQSRAPRGRNPQSWPQRSRAAGGTVPAQQRPRSAPGQGGRLRGHR